MQETIICPSVDQQGVFVQSAYHSDTAYDIQAGIHLLESQLGQFVAQQNQLQLIISRGMLFVEELKSALIVAVKFSPRSSNQLFEEIRYRLDGHSLVEIMNQSPTGNQKQRRTEITWSKTRKAAASSQLNITQESTLEVHQAGSNRSKTPRDRPTLQE